MYSNLANILQLYGVNDRSDTIVGGSYDFKYALANEFYVGFGAKYSQSDVEVELDNRGVKITNSAYEADMDPSTIIMPSFNDFA